MEDTKDYRKAIITFLAIAIIAVIVVAAVVASPKKKDGSATSNVSSTTSSGSNAPSNSSSGTSNSSNASFKDGSYTATGSYESPGGNENITVRVTLQHGVITATSAESGAQDPEASEYQSMFISGYKSQVIGKSISSVSLSRVSGSSLTSQGFNDAISQIENQAKA